MSNSPFIYLVYNTSLLLMLVFIFDLFLIKLNRVKKVIRDLILGFIIAFICIIVMKTHWTLEGGAVFDTRSILISISGLYFGPIPTLITMVSASLFRISQGGVGAFTGVSVIIVTGLTSLLWRKFSIKDPVDYKIGGLYLFGIVIHIEMVILMLTFPWKIAINVLNTVTAPVLLIYPIGTALLGMFMTNRLQKERLSKKIREEEQKFKILADFSTAWDYWTTPEGRFLYCSKSCKDITGYEDSDFYNDPELNNRIVYYEDKHLFKEHKSVIGERIPGFLDYRIINKKGTIKWIGHSCTPVYDIDGNYLGVRASNKDITALKDAEQRLIESNIEIKNLLETTELSRKVLLSMLEDQQIAKKELSILNVELEKRVADRTSQLEAANSELEAFSYSVSHDLRAPLRGISGFTNILIEEYSTKFDSEGVRLCGIIRENAQKMGQLIDDLLSFSRLSRKELQKSVIDTKTMVNSLYYEITTEEERKEIRFNVEDIPQCYGDTTLMRQVFVNLLSNAIKYSAKKDYREITVYSETKDDHMFYYIRDNGAGFDMRYYGKLFGVFQRLHGVNEFEGTGVGLAIVQRIVHRHGGEVGATGEVGSGATFWFSLPKK